MSELSQGAESHAMSRRGFLARGAALSGGLAFGGGVLAACGGGDSGGRGGSKTVGFAMSTFANPRYPNVDLPRFKAAAEAQGFKVLSNQADDDASKQNTNVNSLLARDLAALALLPVNSASAVSLVRKAKRQGVPVLCYNTPMPSGDLAGFVGRDNVAMGELIAKTAVADTGLKGNWVILGGDPGNEVATKTVVGFNNVIKPFVDKGTMRIVGKYDEPGFDNELARKQMQEVLTKTNNKVDGVLAMWEGGVIGSLAALRAEKLAGNVWLGGQDATVVSCRAMVLGEANMSGFTQFDVMGDTGGKLAATLAQGKKLESKQTYDTGAGKIPFFPISIYPVTTKNLVDYLKKYSPSYVDAAAVFEGIPESKWPPGAKELVGA